MHNDAKVTAVTNGGVEKLNPFGEIRQCAKCRS
jgi:hypothetical protein